MPTRLLLLVVALTHLSMMTSCTSEDSPGSPPYRIQVFYPAAGSYMNTNHESNSFSAISELAQSETFAGVQVRVVDGAGDTVLQPTVRPKTGEMTVDDIGKLLDVPVLDRPR